MPHNPSTKKRLRQSKARQVVNRAMKREIKTRAKRLQEAVATRDLDRARDLLGLVVSRIDKASKQNVIHANKAARLKSALMRLVNSAGTPPAEAN